MTPASPAPGRVVLLAGPSGSGKSHLAAASGLPVLSLDEFYKDRDDPSLPRHATLDIVDWDHPQAWDAEAALAAILEVCRHGCAQVPCYDISRDAAAGTATFCRGAHPVFVAEGVFVAEVVQACRDAGVLADAIVLARAPWRNFVRRLARDLAERRKSPLTVLRRGRALMRAEGDLMRRLQVAGCRPLTAEQAARVLASWRDTEASAAPDRHGRVDSA